MNKMDWYNSLPIKYQLSDKKCKHCGGICIETPPNESDKKHVLYGCVNNECKTGFFKGE